MPRTKTIELDGAAFVIAPLTVAQVEQYLETPVEQKSELLGRLLPRSMCGLIALSLGNAGASGDWTPERVREEMDLDTVDVLYKEVLLFSRMKLVKSGETMPAAPEGSPSPEPLPSSQP